MAYTPVLHVCNDGSVTVEGHQGGGGGGQIYTFLRAFDILAPYFII